MDKNTPHSDAADALIKQSEELCSVHDHITNVIANLDIPTDSFEDRYEKDYSHQFDFDAIIRVLLYRQISGFSLRETAESLRRWAYLQYRFGLDRAPTQQTLSHTRRRRFSRQDRNTIKKVAGEIRSIAAAEDILGEPDSAPSIQPEETQEGGLTDREIKRAVQIARNRVFTEFETERASNAKYEDDVFWEIQSYLSMTSHGKNKMKRRSARLSWRGETPHGDTHTRALKKMGRPDSQTTLSDYVDGEGPADWERIRSTLLEPFQSAIGNLIEETDFGQELREPVNVAIDVTPWQFYPSPWKYAKMDIVKDDYPEMVSGLKEKHERGYKFATLTVVGADTPIVLAIEPVREGSHWEENPDSITIADTVERLLSKAQEYVDINKVMADREYDTLAVRDVIDKKNMTYIIPKKKTANQDKKDIADVKEHPSADIAVKNDVRMDYEGRTHEVDFIYSPSSEDSYSIFTTNADVPPDRAEGLTAQYRQRWVIENEYKSIKAHFLPRTCSKDYRVRLFYFVAAVLMYNVWRLTNVLLRQMVSVNLGEKPPVPAGEIIEILTLYRDDAIG